MLGDTLRDGKNVESLDRLPELDDRNAMPMLTAA